MPDATALWFAGPREVELRSEAVPEPQQGEVTVQTLYSAISQGTELLAYRGQIAASLPLDLPSLRGSFGFPLKYGYACVGRVVRAGPGVRLEPGTTVFVLHPHQSAFTIPVASAVPLPAGVPALAGVFTANLDTAVNVVLDAAPRLGETAVVFGLGTVGLLVALLLQHVGAGCVIGVDPATSRREAAQRTGLEPVLAPGPELRAGVRELTDGRLADITIEASGVPDALQLALDCLADEGTALAVSWYGTKPVQLALGERFHRGRLRLRSSQVGQIDPALRGRWDRERRLAVALTLLPRLPLLEMVSHRFPLSQAAEAYQLVDQAPPACQQVVFEY
ncbi:MAG TPA: zinc-binding alcohol dehydrogenase [Chloroflexota bacterium]|nr:zinc-binding alcohol dehydrogenase [Chloroflexota bacterium]